MANANLSFAMTATTVLLTPAKFSLPTRGSDKNVRRTPKHGPGKSANLAPPSKAPQQQSSKKAAKSTLNALASALEALSIKTPVKQSLPSSGASSNNTTPLKPAAGSHSKKDSAVVRAARLLDARRRSSLTVNCSHVAVTVSCSLFHK